MTSKFLILRRISFFSALCGLLAVPVWLVINLIVLFRPGSRFCKIHSHSIGGGEYGSIPFDLTSYKCANGTPLFDELDLLLYYGSPVFIVFCFSLSVLFAKKALRQLDSEQAP